MIRSEVLKNLIPIISDQLVVSNIGLPSQELHMLHDQSSNFYMLGTMGLASSIGLGLALAQSAKVIAIDGDVNMYCVCHAPPRASATASETARLAKVRATRRR